MAVPQALQLHMSMLQLLPVLAGMQYQAGCTACSLCRMPACDLHVHVFYEYSDRIALYGGSVSAASQYSTP